MSGSEISDFRNGIYASNSTDVDLLNNDILGMSNDGMLLGGMTDLLIAGNEFRDQKSNPTVKHKDSIQFLTSSTEAGSRDVVIRDNLIENKEVSHGIFFTNSVYNNGDPNSYHRNILIEDNVLLGNQVHGISVNHGYGVTIRGNVVEQIAGATNVPLINVSRYSAYVLISENTVASVPVPQNATWTVVGNDTGAKQRQHWYGDPGAPVVGRADGRPRRPGPTAPTAPTAPVDTSGARVIDGVLESGDRGVPDRRGDAEVRDHAVSGRGPRFCGRRHDHLQQLRRRHLPAEARGQRDQHLERRGLGEGRRRARLPGARRPSRRTSRPRRAATC